MITVKDLPKRYPGEHSNVILYCPGCRATFSADPSDYCATPTSEILRCGHGGKGKPLNLLLVKKVTRFEVIK